MVHLSRGYSAIPPLKELRTILKWILGESKLKELIDDDSNLSHKVQLERIWKEQVEASNMPILVDCREPEKPAVPTADETILSREAQRKFEEAIAMGQHLTQNMSAALMNKLTEVQRMVSDRAATQPREDNV